MRGQFEYKGLPTCPVQVTSQVGEAASSARNSNNNAWYVNTNNGNRNNNNTNNNNRVVGASELISNCDEWMDAESSAYKNKHHNFDAARVHYHLPELYALAHEVRDGVYYPRPMSAFILTYPVFREAFAPDHIDCIVHHYIAPLFNAVADGVHAANGDISHGNRIGHSAHGMAERIREDIASFNGDSVHMHRDISGFFMNINREKAYELVEELSHKYYGKPDRDEKLSLLYITLTSDPLRGVKLRSLRSAWRHIAANKTLFNARPGYGLPIGKYPSQVVAGIYLSKVDGILATMPGIKAQHFVDDYDITADTAREAHAAVEAIRPMLDELGLRLHPTKISIQPSRNGLLSCGRVVKGDRIYISNRSVRSCKARIIFSERSEEGAKALCRSINSFFGLMAHCSAYNIQLRLAKLVKDGFGEWLYFREEPNHLICVVRKRYTPQREAEAEIVKLINKIYNETGKAYQRNHRPRRSGGRHGGRRAA